MPSENIVQFTHKWPSADGFRAGFYSGLFTIKDFCVTDGQDHNLSVGQARRFFDTTEFDFKVDRYGSKQVADWWTSRVKAEESTFNHDPDNLNFAMRGTLVLTFSRPDSSGGEDGHMALTFEDFFLGQGHSSLSNNWWVAARGAVQSGITGINVKSSETRAANFRRGNTVFGVNEVSVEI